ncbi:MAG: class I SAM-dependent methyltransferase [Xanthomonadaceae bacterium]|nr:class I SAM-dependent methyltransferase [Xanthomonadaceae bacterium]
MNLRFVSCPCCTGNKFSPWYINSKKAKIKNYKEFFYGGAKFISDIWICDHCSFHFINNLEPSYSKWYESQLVDESERLKKFRKDYYQKLKDVLFIPQNLSLPILDIGCGDGTWLSLFSNRERFGTELGAAYNKTLACAGIQVTTLEDLANRKFDLITLFDVLEHLEDPIQYLLNIKNHLAPGGTLIISCPDHGKISSRVLKQRYYLYCPMHFSYFNSKNVELLLRSVFEGSEVKTISAPIMKTDLLGVAKWIGIKQLPQSLSFTLPIGYSANFVTSVRV